MSVQRLDLQVALGHIERAGNARQQSGKSAAQRQGAELPSRQLVAAPQLVHRIQIILVAHS
jgi:hypothetical protein